MAPEHLASVVNAAGTSQRSCADERGLAWTTIREWPEDGTSRHVTYDARDVTRPTPRPRRPLREDERALLDDLLAVDMSPHGSSSSGS
jgi:hypothetical protein